MKTLLRLFPLCAFILLIQAQAQAQVYVGRVVDLSGNGIAGVSVNFRMTCFAGPGPNNPSTNVTNTFLTDTNGNFAGSYPNSSCQYGGPFSSLYVQKEGYYFGSIFRLGAELKVIGSNLPKIASVSAADYQPGMTSEMIVAGFGMGLSAETAIATQSPLPTSLSGKKIRFIDSAGNEKNASLIFVSPFQINFVSPPEMSEGYALMALYDGEQAIRAGVVEISKIIPSIFSANASGNGVAAAVILRVRGNSPGIYEPVAQFDSAQNKYIPLPLDLGPESDSIYLSLFGTGWRGVNAPGDVKVKFRPEADILNPIEVPVQYVGKQPTIEGLDQINVLVPRSLLGKGLINIGVSIKKDDTVAYLTNQVQINIR